MDDLTIPKYIHYCWFGGKELPTEYRQYIDGWMKIHPDYKIVCWNEDTFPIKEYAYAEQAAERKKWAFVSDVARVYALYTMGGIYLDADVEAVRPFPDALNQFAAVLGTESSEVIGTGFIALAKKHPISKSMLDYYQNHSFVDQDEEFANTFLLTQIVERLYGLSPKNCVQSKEDLILFSPEYFTAYDRLSAKPVLTSNTVCIHHFAASWFSPRQKLRRLWWRVRRFLHFV